MVCNKNPKKSIKLSLLENSIGHLTLDNKPFQIVESLKYLGVTISNKNSPDKHILQRKQTTISALTKLEKLSVYNNQSDPRLIAYLFQAFIRPVSIHGTENFILSSARQKVISKIDTKALKRMLNISSRCHHSDLINVLKIGETNATIKLNKVSLFKRLAENELTYKTLEELNKIKYKRNYQPNFVREIKEIL